MNFDVFLSHNSKDKPAVESIAHKLQETYSLKCWLDKWNLIPGEPWQEALEEALDDCQTVAVFVGPNIISPWENEEMRSALEVRVHDKDRRIVPVLLPGAPAGEIKPGVLKGLPPGSYLPFPRNEKFVGREDDLENLHAALQGGESVGVRPAMLSGMGGIGKTQLAVEYAYRYGTKYPGGIYWVNAAQDLLLQGMAEVAEKIGLRTTDDVSESQRLTYLANALAKHLNSQLGALVVFDNVEDSQVLRLPVASFIPSELNCHILFTTRRRDVNKTFYRSFEVTVLPENTALQLLLRHPTRQPVIEPKHNDHAWARIICITLGYLPLAIELAGAYLGKYDEISLQDYRYRLLDEGAMETVDDTELRPEDMPTRHDTAINATLKLSWEAIQGDPDAQLALKAAGQLHEGELISTHLLNLLTKLKLETKPGHPSPLGRTLKKLFEFSLIEELSTENLRLHPLVFAFVSHLAEDDFRIQMADRLTKTFCEINLLNRAIINFGVDAVLANVRTGLWLYGNYASENKEELCLLDKLLDREAHYTRDWKHATQPGFITQQLYNRALDHDMEGWKKRLKTYLDAQKHPWIKENFPFSRTSQNYVRTFRGHSSRINSVAVTPNGKFVISASADKTLRVWDLASGQQLRILEGHSDTVEDVAVTPDGKKAISASSDKTLRLWDLASGQQLRVLEGHTEGIHSVVITPDGKYAISSSYGSTDRTLFSDSFDKTLRQWDLVNGQQLRVFRGIFSKPNRNSTGFNPGIKGIAITPDGKKAFFALTGRLMVWDLASGQKLRSVHSRSNSKINDLAITPDGKYAIYASSDNTLRLWDLSAIDQELWIHDVRVFKGHIDQINNVAVTPDSKYAISASSDMTLRLWDINSGLPLLTFEGHSRSVNGVAITPDGKYAISTSSDMTLRLWNINSGLLLRTFEGHAHSFNGVLAITPDGKYAISCSSNKTLRLWNINSGLPLPMRIFEGHSGSVTSVAITLDGKYAISSSSDMTLRLWNINSDLPLRTFKGHSDSVTGVAITRDGKYAISSSSDMTLRLWNINSGRCYTTLASEAPFDAVAIDPNNVKMVAGDTHGIVHFIKLINM